MLKTLFLILLCPSLYAFDFSLASERPFEPKWQGRALNALEQQQLDEALSQRYLYLDSGMQSNAFLSEDKKYVLKLFKKEPFLIEEGAFYIPLFSEWRKARQQKKRSFKRSKVFSAYANCFNAFAQETGILYVHFNTTDTLKRSLNFTDASDSVPLDEVDFIIEKRADSVRDYLQALKADSDVIHAMRSLIELHYRFYKKGMRNRDIELAKNFGFIDGRPVLFDVGKVVPSQEKKDKRKYQKKLHILLAGFRTWMSEFNPSLLPQCDAAIAYALENYYE